MTLAINKAKLLKAIQAQLHDELSTAINASKTAHESATHSENIAENKYDTLGLEAAYLAHGQSLRIEELNILIEQLSNFHCPDFIKHSAIQAGALVTLLDDNDCQRLFFISPSTGAMSLEFQGQPLQVVSINAPLGKMLNNKHCGDEITLTINNRSHSYEVMAVE